MIMTVCKTNLHMILTHTMVPYVLLYTAEFIRENTVLCLIHGATETVHKPQSRRQQLHDNTTNQVGQFIIIIFIIEDTSVMVRKGLGDGSQVLSTRWATFISAVTPIWFQNTMQSIYILKKNKGNSYWSNHKKWHRLLSSFFINSIKDALSLPGVCSQYLWLVTFSKSSLLVIYSSLQWQSTFVKKVWHMN